MLNEQVTGLFLLGRRDPDDYYAPTETPTLQALTNQTAIALLNIEQASNLRSLHQVNIERQECERNHLALELHDSVLSQMAILAMNADENQVKPQFWNTYKETVHTIREMIGGLRPRMLGYGLRAALDELVDETRLHAGQDLTIEIEIPASQVRYPEAVELHLYRIVQQACQNAVKHTQARRLWLEGQLEPGYVFLQVQDDGVGFESTGELDLNWLLANRHFGLAGIFQRAAFIGAKVEVHSVPGEGTQVQVTWRGADNPSFL